MKNSKNGITLIALVITIIVLLILAGISISLITGQNGVLTKAEDASNTYSMASAKEQGELVVSGYLEAYYDDKYVKGELDSSITNERAYILNQLQSGGQESGGYNVTVEGSGDNTQIIVKKSGTEVIRGNLNYNGVITWKETANIGENGENGSGENNNGSGENNGGNQGGTTPTEPTKNYITTIQTTAATKPYLPTGYSVAQESIDAENTSAGGALAEGLIITDGSGNEYVWIEVPRTIYSSELQSITAGTNLTDAQYTAIETAMQTYAVTYRPESNCRSDVTGFEDSYNSNMGTIGNITSKNDYNILKKSMLKSVFENGGFYVGRYEAGIEVANARKAKTDEISSTLVPLSKANVAPINYVTCSQSQTLASKVAPNGNTSSLMFGIQWDLMIKFIEVKTNLTTEDLRVDCGSWGNYCFSGDFNVSSTTKAYNKSTQLYEDMNPDIKQSSKCVLLTTGATKGAASPDNDRNCKANINDVAGNVGEWVLEYSSLESTPYRYLGGSYGNTGTGGCVCWRETNDYSCDARRDGGFRVSIF